MFYKAKKFLYSFIFFILFVYTFWHRQKKKNGKRFLYKKFSAFLRKGIPTWQDLIKFIILNMIISNFLILQLSERKVMIGGPGLLAWTAAARNRAQATPAVLLVRFHDSPPENHRTLRQFSQIAEKRLILTAHRRKRHRNVAVQVTTASLENRALQYDCPWNGVVFVEPLVAVVIVAAAAEQRRRAFTEVQGSLAGEYCNLIGRNFGRNFVGAGGGWRGRDWYCGGGW